MLELDMFFMQTYEAEITVLHVFPPFAGFISFRSLMKEREVVEGAWQATIKGGGKQIMMLFLMELQ